MRKLFEHNALVALITAALVLLITQSYKESDSGAEYRSPETVEFSPDGKILALNDLTSNLLYLVNVKTKNVFNQIELNNKPQDIVWIDDQELLVSEYETGKVLKINAASGIVEKEYEVGPHTFHMALNGDELWVNLYGLKKIAVVDLNSGKTIETIATESLPWDMQLVPGKNMMLVANLIPYEKANGKNARTSVSIFDTQSKEKIKDVMFPHGSTNFRHLEVSSDGKWAYAVHTRGKVNLPTSQIEKGWVNTNMMTIIDLEAKEWYASVLLDKVKQGAPDPWDVVSSKDGKLYVSIATLHELATIDAVSLHQHLAGEAVPDNLQASNANAYTAFDVWQTIKKSPENRAILQDQISALYAAGLLEREKLPMKGPRGLSLSADGKTLAIAGYYTGNVALKDLTTGEITTISLGSQPQPDQVRRGEMAFHDATKTVENWLSCFTCHPDIRADGLNWDLLNDGIGNPKNTKSLVGAHETPPSMSTGVRANYKVAVQKGFHFIKFYRGNEEEWDEVRAYLAAIPIDKSPYALKMENDKEFRRSVQKGKKLFVSGECQECHTPPLYTNLEQYDFGIADERGITEYDVPSLRELWRTAPYWHDGSKADLHALLTDHDLQGIHGTTIHMDANDIQDLTNYLLTL